jgi:hypothetical protein
MSYANPNVVTNIRDLANATDSQGSISPWRTKLLPAHFDDALFHVEAGSRESGRRTVTHTFPKKDYPYSEDMGRRPVEFTVRGYIIQYPMNRNTLYQRDYTVARDILQRRLEEATPRRAGVLQLPMAQDPMMVVCTRYRMTEEDKLGGYVVFDMTFVEVGVAPGTSMPSASSQLIQRSQAMRNQIVSSLTMPTPTRVAQMGPPFVVTTPRPPNVPIMGPPFVVTTPRPPPGPIGPTRRGRRRV